MNDNTPRVMTLKKTGFRGKVAGLLRKVAGHIERPALDIETGKVTLVPLIQGAKISGPMPSILPDDGSKPVLGVSKQ